MKNNITLIGMPGAGKSTLGVVLAKKLGYRFCDTDLLIQEGYDALLSELIASRGIDGFKKIENEVLAGMDCERHIIATGGSAVYGEQAMQHLGSIGVVVFIDISLPEMQKRLGSDLAARGVVMPADFTLEDLYNERHPLYERYADITIETSGIDTRTAVGMLEEALRQEGFIDG